MPRRPALIYVPWHMYRHFPADFSRWREAAVGFKGWEYEIRPLDLRQTCLALMHFPDTGLTPETEFGPDCPVPNALGTIEWIPRAMDVVTFRMPRLVAAARAAGLQVAHIGVSGGIYTQGPVWERCVQEAGPPPPEDKDRIEMDPRVAAQHLRDVFDLPRQKLTLPPDYQEMDKRIRKTIAGRNGKSRHTQAYAVDFPQDEKAKASQRPALPPELLPQDNDIIAQHAWQLHRLLKNRNITHIIYSGWALNWCLWFSPCGMCDMHRKGYLCSAVRGGCVAIENAESAVGEKNLEYAYWKTSTMFGYIFDLHELTHALREYASNKSASKRK